MPHPQFEVKDAPSCQINDVGRELNEEFGRLYERFFASQMPSVDALHIEELKPDAHRYFDAHPTPSEAHGIFFDNFIHLWWTWAQNGRFYPGIYIWEKAAELATSWEDLHPGQRIHKGTPYYFWGMTLFLAGNLDAGFLLMHQALDEDVKTLATDTPKTAAFAFVTLDYTESKQAFRGYVQEIADFLDVYLLNYRASRGRKLSLVDIRSKFLGNPALRHAVFDFVFIMAKLHSLLQKKGPGSLPPALRMNDFAAIMESDLIFGICRLLDVVIRKKDPKPKEKLFEEIRDFLSPALGLSLTQKHMEELNVSFKANFVNTANDLLNNRLFFKDGTSLTLLGTDIALFYGFRNFGAHQIAGTTFLYSNFEEIIKRVLNALFFIIEGLY